MPRVFLSYNRKDRAHAERVKRLLDDRNISNFVDFEELRPGRMWTRAIAKAIADWEPGFLDESPFRRTWERTFEESLANEVKAAVVDVLVELRGPDWADESLEIHEVGPPPSPFLPIQMSRPPRPWVNWRKLLPDF